MRSLLIKVSFNSVFNKSSKIYFPSIINKSFHLATNNLKERLYSEKHEWVVVDKNVGTIGISNYAQEALGDIVYAQLPKVGDSFTAHDECGALESVKAASELYTPVSGEVLEVNANAEKSPSIVNKSCYNEGWLFKLKITKSEELKSLMNEEAYSKYLKSQKSD